MLEVITLAVIKKIFELADCEVSPASRLLYIDCLMAHFCELEATKKNSYAFNMYFNQIPNYEKYIQHFEQLKKAGLVSINYDFLIVVFNNVWGQHIDKNKLRDGAVISIQDRPQTMRWFAISGRSIEGKITDWFFEHEKDFYSVWLMQQRPDVNFENEFIDYFDAKYNTTNFESEKHIRSAFIKTWNEKKNERTKSNSFTGAKSGSYVERKASVDELGDAANQVLRTIQLRNNSGGGFSE